MTIEAHIAIIDGLNQAQSAFIAGNKIEGQVAFTNAHMAAWNYAKQEGVNFLNREAKAYGIIPKALID
jgi:hypothetical protein